MAQEQSHGLMAHLLKSVIAFQGHEDLKEGRSNVFAFLEKLFCGRTLREGPDQRRGKRLGYEGRAMIRAWVQVVTVR